MDKQFKLFTEARCVKSCHKYNQTGTIVATFNDTRKVLFENDKVEGPLDTGQNLANAYWFDIDEIEEIDDETIHDT